MSHFGTTVWTLNVWTRNFTVPYDPTASKANFNPARIPTSSAIGGEVNRTFAKRHISWSPEDAVNKLLLLVDSFAFTYHERGIFWQDWQIREDGSGWGVVFLRDGSRARELQITVGFLNGVTDRLPNVEGGFLEEEVDT